MGSSETDSGVTNTNPKSVDEQILSEEATEFHDYMDEKLDRAEAPEEREAFAEHRNGKSSRKTENRFPQPSSFQREHWRQLWDECGIDTDSVVSVTQLRLMMDVANVTNSRDNAHEAAKAAQRRGDLCSLNKQQFCLRSDQR
ncbi:hypothetical protein [Halomarina rubra]|nr:hypothetical protein [Halomarina rubra]